MRSYLALFIVGCELSACHADTALDDVLMRLAALEQKNAALAQKSSALEADNAALKEKTNDLDADNAEIKADNDALKADNAEIKAALGAPTPGELRLFAADAWPTGWAEFNRTQGYLLAGRPDGATAGTQLNRPLEAGEAGRAPPHAHDVTVSDPGHTHAATVKDPGHDHYRQDNYLDSGNPGFYASSISGNHIKPAHDPVFPNFTGIEVVNNASKSAIDVSISANDGGEHLPLVYVLICQKI